MTEKSLTVDVPSGTLVVFDPEALAHRRAGPATWSAADLLAEQSAAKLSTLELQRRDAVHLRVIDDAAAELAAAPEPGGEKLTVSSGRVFFGDRSELPSKRWGRKRWNVWDLLFLAFVLSLPLFGLWFSGFGENLVWIVIVTGALFIAALVPITWAVFRHGREFKRRTGVPPNDFPERVVELAPGTYRVAYERRPEALLVRFVRVAG